ncbi:MAG: glycosyltransferase [Paludibacteraceae bacterium]|nr:glycosyltransferase [Paludibacteraceae bacterium]
MLNYSSPYKFIDSDLCCVIPTYNNATTIVDVVKRCLRQTQHVIVVNDGSTDNTLALLHPFLKRIELVTYEQNIGKGGALKAGFLRAKELGYRYALTLDADGQHYPEDIPLLIEKVRYKPDAIIIGERPTRGQTRSSRFANQFSNFWFCVQTATHLNDTQTGMRIYPLHRLPNLNLLTARYESELELLVWSAWRGTQIIPVPIRVYYPPQEQRVSHFKPAKDFTRISVFNTIMCFGALLYGYPRMLLTSLFRHEWPYYPLTAFKWLLFVIEVIFLLLPFSFFYFLIHGKNKKSLERYHRYFQRIALHPITIPWHTKVEIHNDFKETFSKPAIVICNHASLVDVFALLSLTPKIVILAKAGYAKHPIIGPILHYANFYPVSEGYETITHKLKEKVEQGFSIAIFPEGTRTTDGNIRRFHRGAFYLAEQFGLDIIPCYVENSFQLWPKKCNFPKKGTIHLDVLPRIKPHDTSFGIGYRKRAKGFERYYKELHEQKPSVHIIGGGIGGLFTGALLSKNGYRVCIIEKNAIVGGGLQSFRRDGVSFNTGMHLFGGMEPDGTLRRILNYIGITDQLKIVPTDPQAQDLVFVGNKTYKMPKGKQATIEYLSQHFPAEHDGIKTYFDDLYTIAESYDLFRLRHTQEHPEAQELLNLTAQQLITRHITDPTLYKLLCYHDILIGKRPNETNAGMHAMIELHYLEGEVRMVGGSQQMADALVAMIKQHGGVVLNNSEVTKINTQHKHIVSIETKNGLCLPTEKVVSAIAPRYLTSICNEQVFRNFTQKRVQEPLFGDTGCIVFIKLKPQTFPYIPSSIFLPNPTNDDKQPSHWLVSTTPQGNQCAQTIEILIPGFFSEFEQWADTLTGHRPTEYYDAKEKMAQKAIDYVATFFPQLKVSIDKIYTSSPLTVRDYYNTPNGNIFGQQGLYTPIITNLDNLYTTGQACIYHGMCGVPLTAILTTQTILGKEIIDEM